jgi:hypothetical protein
MLGEKWRRRRGQEETLMGWAVSKETGEILADIFENCGKKSGCFARAARAIGTQIPEAESGGGIRHDGEGNRW